MSEKKQIYETINNVFYVHNDYCDWAVRKIYQLEFDVVANLGTDYNVI